MGCFPLCFPVSSVVCCFSGYLIRVSLIYSQPTWGGSQSMWRRRLRPSTQPHNHPEHSLHHRRILHPPHRPRLSNLVILYSIDSTARPPSRIRLSVWFSAGSQKSLTLV